MVGVIGIPLDENSSFLRGAAHAQYPRLLALGGDHSISYPVIKAVAQRYTRLNVLHIDAHADLYESFEGNRFSHAYPFARLMEEKCVHRLVQVGIRTLNPHQREQAQRFGVDVVEMKNFSKNQKFSFEGPVYLSLDLDALDPAFAPGVSHPEPGGLTTRNVISLIQRKQGELVGADVVELNPARDLNGITALIAAKFFKEILARLV
jgi:agmatinase